MKFLGENVGVYRSRKGNIAISFVLNSPNAIELAQSIPKGVCEIEVNKVRKDRTINQNAMLWKLIGEISKAEDGKRTPELDQAIYRSILKRAGAKEEVISIKKDALKTFLQRTGDIFRAYMIGHTWVAHGVEWVLLYAYYGSSTMDTEEMGKVIDEALSYASEVGLDADAWRLEFYDTE